MHDGGDAVGGSRLSIQLYAVAHSADSSAACSSTVWSARTRRVEPGLIIDFAPDGQAIGIEITAPSKVSLAALNAMLQELGHGPATEANLAPVLAA